MTMYSRPPFDPPIGRTIPRVGQPRVRGRSMQSIASRIGLQRELTIHDPANQEGGVRRFRPLSSLGPVADWRASGLSVPTPYVVTAPRHGLSRRLHKVPVVVHQDPNC